MEQKYPHQSREQRICSFASRLSHLDIDFNRLHQPGLVDVLLVACTGESEQASLTHSEVSRLTLASRMQYLLAVTIRTLGHELLLQCRCSNESCQELIELPLDLSQFRQQHSEPAADIRIDGDSVSLRMPTGEDQERWLERGETVDSAAMARDLVTAINGNRPATDWSIPPGWVEIIGEKLEKLDALTVLQLNTRCPACGRTLLLDLDLEQQLLAELEICQHRALDEIHRLASVYHWRERDILELPPQRRAYYISRLERDSLS